MCCPLMLGTGAAQGIPVQANPAGVRPHPHLSQYQFSLNNKQLMTFLVPIPSQGGQEDPMWHPSLPYRESSNSQSRGSQTHALLLYSQHGTQGAGCRGWVWDPPADWQHQHKVVPCFPDPLPALGSQTGKQSFRGWEEKEKRLMKLCEREHARRKTRARKSDWQAALSPGACLPVRSAALLAQMRLSQGKPSPSFASPPEHAAAGACAAALPVLLRAEAVSQPCLSAAAASPLPD